MNRREGEKTIGWSWVFLGLILGGIITYAAVKYFSEPLPEDEKQELIEKNKGNIEQMKKEISQKMEAFDIELEDVKKKKRLLEKSFYDGEYTDAELEQDSLYGAKIADYEYIIESYGDNIAIINDRFNELSADDVEGLKALDEFLEKKRKENVSLSKEVNIFDR